jgi:hypothetical protein
MFEETPRQTAARVGNPAESYKRADQDSEQDSPMDKGKVIGALSNLFLDLLTDKNALRLSQDPAAYITQKVYQTFGSFYNKDCDSQNKFKDICIALRFHTNHEINHPNKDRSLQDYLRGLISRGLAEVNSLLNINWQTYELDYKPDNDYDPEQKEAETRFQKTDEVQINSLRGYFLMSVYLGDLSPNGIVKVDNFFKYYYDPTVASNALDNLTLLASELQAEVTPNSGGSAKDVFLKERREYLKIRAWELLKVCTESHLEQAKNEYLGVMCGPLIEWFKKELTKTKGDLVKALNGASLKHKLVREKIARAGVERYNIPPLVCYGLKLSLGAWGIVE